MELLVMEGTKIHIETSQPSDIPYKIIYPSAVILKHAFP